MQGEIKFIAAQQIPVDSVRVRMEAIVGSNASRPTGGSAVARSHPRLTSELVSQLRQEAREGRGKNRGGQSPNGLMAFECATYWEVVVKNDDCPECSIPLEALRVIPNDPYSPFYSINGPVSGLNRCSREHGSDEWTAGVTQLDSWSHRPKYSCVTVFVDNLHFEVNWGYCLENFPEPYKSNIVDESLSNLSTVFDAESAIRDFRTSSATGTYGGKKFYPLLRTGCHEQFHTGQYVRYLSEEFNIALLVIANQSPVQNWCKLTDQQFREA
jgi:hypothetical protein